MTGAGPMAEPPSPRTPHPVQTGGVHARRDVTLKCLGEPAWPKSLWGLVKEPKGWLEEYHLRSRVESFWGALKARSPEKIRKQVPHAQVVEATLRAVVHNLRQLCYWRWVAQLEPKPNTDPPVDVGG